MDINTDLVQLSTDLSKVISNSHTTVQIITDKINLVRGKKNSQEIINNLEEIIHELIAEKNQLISIAQGFDERMVAQKMSDNEIEYVTKTIIPMLRKFIEESNDDHSDKSDQLDAIETLLTKETLNVLQILGFNFKVAIGEPLTELVRELILSQMPVDKTLDYHYQTVREQRELEFLKVLQNDKAYERLVSHK
ncbi:hypothetical protein FZC83_02170 [Rossellomorea marisflavi]|uniref:Uncharacterized protein n=1 Tax=Rossellomorea marisflavi TaxID=189381 RepID=A0A5D4S3F8_9BACI|nr:hypothetical protein [Rossellomorea marisflavi]TYS56402.1 hypothetical protein FZC83_02170 [Rossellomorea marisflavi]